VYEDNANRCILLYIDDSVAQDQRVMDYQKKMSAGKISWLEEDRIKTKHQNMQRLLEPVEVINPYAELIDLPSSVFKPRRSLQILLSFIETITFYHQHQRKLKTNAQGQAYIESTYQDIAWAFRLLKEVLFTKSDELTKASRKFLERLKQIIQPGDTFYTSPIRKQLRMNASNLKRYMVELQRYGDVKSKGGNRYRGYEYQISDYTEYEQLKSNIDHRLQEILLKIKGLDTDAGQDLSSSVDQSGSMVKMDHLTITESVR